jgi:hypothetical protein
MNQVDFKDHVEHLRTIQFTLLLVCVAVVFLSFSDREVDSKKAYSDIKEIKSFVLGNFVSPNWLHDYKKGIEASKGVKPINPSSIVLGVPDQPFKLNGGGGFNQFADIDLDHEKTRHLFTLENFKKQWNSLFGLRGRLQISSLKDNVAVFDKELDHYKLIPWRNATKQDKKLPRPRKYKPLYSLNVVDADSKNWLEKCQMKVNWNSPSWFDGLEKLRGAGNKVLCMTFPYGSYENNGLTDTTEKQRNFLEKHLLIFPVDVEDIPYDPLGYFISESGFDWPNRPFEMAFKELDSITKKYKETHIGIIEEILAEEYARDGDRVQSERKIQVFGADLPAATAREWGGLIIAIIQLYFLLHFRALYHFVRKNSDCTSYIPIAWIGLYKDKAAHYVFLFVSSLLPFISVILLLGKTIYLDNYNMYILSLGLLSLTCSFIISYYTLIAVLNAYKSNWTRTTETS